MEHVLWEPLFLSFLKTFSIYLKGPERIPGAGLSFSRLCHDLCDACVGDHPLADRARLDLPTIDLTVLFEVVACEVERGTARFCAGSTQERVHLSMDRRACSIVAVVMLAALPKASMQVATVRLSTGGTVVPSSDDLVVGDDNGAVMPPEAGGSSTDCPRDVEVVCIFTRPHSLHRARRLCSRTRSLRAVRPSLGRTRRARSASRPTARSSCALG